MVFADAVLREQLRMHPIVPAVWRRALQDIEVDGKRIPKVPDMPVRTLLLTSRHLLWWHPLWRSLDVSLAANSGSRTAQAGSSLLCAHLICSQLQHS